MTPRNALSSILLLLALAWLVGCSSPGSARKQYLEFQAFTVEQGVYRPKPGWTFTHGKDKTIVAARANDSIVISPCECSLETGGNCAQATRDGPDGDVAEVWCVDNNCGFCVGGAADPSDPSTSVRFDVVCLKDRKVSQ